VNDLVVLDVPFLVGAGPMGSRCALDPSDFCVSSPGVLLELDNNA